MGKIVVKAVYPGSFDPPTNGHIDIINRALTIFDKVIVAVISNPSKKTLFTVDERMKMLEHIYRGNPDVEISNFTGLLMDFAKKEKVTAIIRGLRAVSDFEYEFQMAQMNSKLDSRVNSVYLMPSTEFTYLSSSIIKEVYSLGGDVEALIPPVVSDYLKNKFNK